MICRIVDIKNKEVISVRDGCRIGCVNDVEVDMLNARLVAIIVYGKLKLFGLLGREEDIVIKWENIQVIGEDTVLVKYNPVCRRKKTRLFPALFKCWK